jgi:hypothetical protein
MADRPKRRHNALVLLVVGALTGAILLSPAGAHVTGSISHLWGGANHIKSKVQKFSDGRYVRHGVNSYLPRGKTQTGTIMSRVEGEGFSIDDASFLMPINFDPTVVMVDNDAATANPAECPGTVNSPRAAPGYACIYAGFISGGTDHSWDGVWDPATGSGCGCRRGMVIHNFNPGPGYLESAGSWAVTAPRNPTSPARPSAPARNPRGTGAQE